MLIYTFCNTGWLKIGGNPFKVLAKQVLTASLNSTVYG